MNYSILDGRLIAGSGGQVAVTVGPYSPQNPPKDPGEIPPRIFSSAFGHKSSHFESHEQFDLICYEPVDILAPERVEAPICIFMEADHMHFYCPDEALVDESFRLLIDSDFTGLTSGGLLYCFLNQQVSGDRERLEALEGDLNALENEVLTGVSGENYNRRFVALRKRLVRVKRYYEQLTDLLEELSGNENGLFDKRSLKHISLLRGKVGRLCQKAENLLDYISGIRDAYQAETDLRLNKTMQVLTIITVIVLPLTLIAGWYGMNLSMPEYRLPFAYPAVIILSVAIVVACIWYFKKHKWF